MAEEKEDAITLNANESELTDQDLETVAGGATASGAGCTPPPIPTQWVCHASGVKGLCTSA